jgi:hypothetical protein
VCGLVCRCSFSFELVLFVKIFCCSASALELFRDVHYILEMDPVLCTRAIVPCSLILIYPINNGRFRLITTISINNG